MKLNLGRRIVLFIHWLASLVLLANIIFPDYVAWGLSYFEWVPADYMQIATIALLVIYLLASLFVLCMVFRRGSKRADRGFITVDAADTGKVRIAISAIEQMVKQAAYTVDGISDMKISINNSDDAIEIHVNVVMINGSHVPTVTLNMQRAIRQYVEMNCGVAVRSVSVSIQSVTASAESGKRGKRHDSTPIPAPVSAPVQPVQDWVEEKIQPVAAPVAEPVPEIEPIAPAVDEPAYYSVDTESAVAEENADIEAAVVEETPDEAYAAVEEMNTEEEKEN